MTADVLVPALGLLSIVLGIILLCVVLASRSNERGWREIAQDASLRARRAEHALAEIRQRRSIATSKGNRTRADTRRADARAEVGKAEPEFPLTPDQTGDAQ